MAIPAIRRALPRHGLQAHQGPAVRGGRDGTPGRRRHRGRWPVEQQHARTGQDLHALLRPRAPRADRRRRPTRMVRSRERRGTDGWYLDAGGRHRPRRGAHPPGRGSNRDDCHAKRRGRAAMMGLLSERTRWAIVMAFAIAMAWVEAASVFYIRALVDRIEPYQADPLPMHGALGNVELWREAATLVMIGTLGVLAGRTWRRRAGYAALAFGAWDIFYYVFLRLISGWPGTLLDWDILFLLPLPLWGPVLAPVSIALVMIVWGTLATQSGDDATDSRWAWALGWVGIVLALALFMIDAWRALPDGRHAVLQVLPSTF